MPNKVAFFLGLSNESRRLVYTLCLISKVVATILVLYIINKQRLKGPPSMATSEFGGVRLRITEESCNLED